MRISPLRAHFEAHPVDWSLWHKLFKKHQKEYLRQRLRMISIFAQGYDIEATARQLGVTPHTVRKHLRSYQKGGLEAVVRPKQHRRPGRLTEAQQEAFKRVVLESTPQAEGLEGETWTGNRMRAWIRKTYDVEMKSGIYDMIRRLGLNQKRTQGEGFWA
jgi:transposase